LVLRSGGDFNFGHAHRLACSIAANLTLPHRIVLLSDQGPEFESEVFRHVRLAHDWPKWWSKLELFRPGLFEEGARVLFFDLDTVIAGNLDELARTPFPFAGLRDFYFPDRFASGVMSFIACSEISELYGTFREQPELYMGRAGGDQRFIRDAWIGAGRRFSFLQDSFPGQIVSFKVHTRPGARGLPAGARVLCFHGFPRPWECHAPWVRDLLRKF
jgi:hypothetical protein